MAENFWNIPLVRIKDLIDSSDDKRTSRLNEINLYENSFLLKPENGTPSYPMDDDMKLDLYNDIYFEGMHRYYIEKLYGRDYTLEGSSPYKIRLLDTVITDTAWGNFVCQVVKLLIKNYPNCKDDLLMFKVSWGSAEIFSTTSKINYKELDDNLYMNCNHTAQHLCWLLQDTLDYFNISTNNLKMLIHRASCHEPKRVKEHIESIFVMGFDSYLCREHKATKDISNKIIQYIKKYLNPMLSKISRCDNNFFLFDDLNRLSNCIKRVQEYMQKKSLYSEKDRNTLTKCLEYLKEYYYYR